MKVKDNIMNNQQLQNAIDVGNFDKLFKELYPSRHLSARARYLQIVDSFVRQYGPSEDLRLFSVPGRVEIGGNHTDHQHGHVLAAAITLDAVAAAAKNDSDIISVYSAGFGEIRLSLSDLAAVPKERGNNAALIRGIAARFRQLGYEAQGFDAYISSDVPPGSGMSPSAAFEVLIATIINGLFNDSKIPPVTLAQIGKYAETVYYGKPNGLMYQCACAVGGFCAIDFENFDEPEVEFINCDLTAHGYALCLVAAGGSHANLTNEHAAIPAEMRGIARYFRKEFLGEVSRAEFEAALYRDLRIRFHDRALLRALHFFDEDERVISQIRALREGDIKAFLQCVRDSGHSSAEVLQNIYPSGNINERTLSLAFGICGNILGRNGAWRINGEGFIGSVLAIVPVNLLDNFREKIEIVFGPGRCYVLTVRQAGSFCLNKE